MILIRLRCSKDKASSESTISLYIQQGDELRHQANMDFSSAHNEAVKTMLSTANIEKKMIAAKIRILTTLHLNSFFDGSVKRSLNMPLIKDYIMQAWNEAINLNEVKTAISDEFEPSIFRNGVLMVWGKMNCKAFLSTRCSGLMTASERSRGTPLMLAYVSICRRYQGS